MENNTLKHYGILGMKWGVRRHPNKDGTLTVEGKRHKNQTDGPNDNSVIKETNNKQNSSSKSVKDLSDDELLSKIRRLELEKRYKDLSQPKEKARTSRGKAFIDGATDVLAKSAKNIATQAVTYAMGEAVNRIAAKALNKQGLQIVNPKKGQKDK